MNKLIYRTCINDVKKGYCLRQRYKYQVRLCSSADTNVDYISMEKGKKGQIIQVFKIEDGVEYQINAKLLINNIN